MKIRFEGDKEREPTRDQGLRVLYAPGKRTAYRLRWYLILLLIASPLLWFLGRVVIGAVLIDAPGKVVREAIDIRAFDSARVSAVYVRPGDRVEEGDPLIRMDNPVLRQQKEQLAELEAFLTRNAITQVTDLQSSVLNRQLDRAETRVSELETLVEAGSATRGELQAARRERDSRESELLSFQLNLLDRQQTALSQQRELTRLTQERGVLDRRLEELQVNAPAAGRVRQVLVNPGENLATGHLMMQLEPDEEFRIRVFLSPRYMDLATPGQSLTLRLPDGREQKARVDRIVSAAEPIPEDLRRTFGSRGPNLVLEVSPTDPLPDGWQVHGLPLDARFPNRVQRWFD